MIFKDSIWWFLKILSNAFSKWISNVLAKTSSETSLMTLSETSLMTFVKCFSKWSSYTLTMNFKYIRKDFIWCSYWWLLSMLSANALANAYCKWSSLFANAHANAHANAFGKCLLIQCLAHICGLRTVSNDHESEELSKLHLSSLLQLIT